MAREITPDLTGETLQAEVAARPRPHFTWRLRTRTLELGDRTVLMGIVNVTPDSFSDGGHFLSPTSALSQAMRLLDEGADLIDLGGESTRPNAIPISSDQECDRVLPVLESIMKARPDTLLSVDTYHASTAARALAAGAEIVNDVSGLSWDGAMADVLAGSSPEAANQPERGPGVILMHTRGRPSEWQGLPALDPGEVVPLVWSGLAKCFEAALARGIARESIVLDPGFGFGKLGHANFSLLAGFAAFSRLGQPLLAGLSRKRFLTAPHLSPSAEERQHSTNAANVAAVLAGAHVLRVHDVSTARMVCETADRVVRSR